MTDEERQRQMDFIVEQQAQLTVTVQRLSEKVDGLTDKVDRTADAAAALLTIADIHEREIQATDELFKATDERLNALIAIVERHISEGRNGRG